MGDVLESHAEQLFVAVAGDVGDRLVDLDPAAIQRHDRHANRRVLHDRAEAVLALAQRLLDQVALRNIGGHRHHQALATDLDLAQKNLQRKHLAATQAVHRPLRQHHAGLRQNEIVEHVLAIRGAQMARNQVLDIAADQQLQRLAEDQRRVVVGAQDGAVAGNTRIACGACSKILRSSASLSLSASACSRAARSDCRMRRCRRETCTTQTIAASSRQALGAAGMIHCSRGEQFMAQSVAEQSRCWFAVATPRRKSDHRQASSDSRSSLF
jgi:hypothetical protein